MLMDSRIGGRGVERWTVGLRKLEERVFKSTGGNWNCVLMAGVGELSASNI